MLLIYGTEEELKWEDDIWSFDNIRKLALASFYKLKKKNEKLIFMTVKKYLLDKVAASYC